MTLLHAAIPNYQTRASYEILIQTALVSATKSFISETLKWYMIKTGLLLTNVNSNFVGYTVRGYHVKGRSALNNVTFQFAWSLLLSIPQFTQERALLTQKFCRIPLQEWKMIGSGAAKCCRPLWNQKDCMETVVFSSRNQCLHTIFRCKRFYEQFVLHCLLNLSRVTEHGFSRQQQCSTISVEVWCLINSPDCFIAQVSRCTSCI